MIELDTTQPTPKHEITELRVQLSAGFKRPTGEESEYDEYVPVFVRRAEVTSSEEITDIEAFRKELHVMLDPLINEVNAQHQNHRAAGVDVKIEVAPEEESAS